YSDWRRHCRNTSSTRCRDHITHVPRL
ncbi:hypothetical protein BN1723_020084, partial [Verticillium longisporum]